METGVRAKAICLWIIGLLLFHGLVGLLIYPFKPMDILLLDQMEPERVESGISAVLGVIVVPLMYVFIWKPLFHRLTMGADLIPVSIRTWIADLFFIMVSYAGLFLGGVYSLELIG